MIQRIESRAKKAEEEKIEKRTDDTKEVATKRITKFHEETMGVVEKLKQLGKLIEIDSNGSIEQVNERVSKVFQRLSNPIIHKISKWLGLECGGCHQ